jgi:LysR family hydrogen peroxide-inducible transcriptional activator
MVSAPSIGVIPTICPFLLPKVLPVLNTHHPQAKLNIVEEQSHLLVETVRRGDLDAAILALPYPYEGLLGMKTFFWVDPKENPLSQQNAIL